MPSLPALRGFEAAVRAGSFSAAARELNVTHAAVAQHVRSLETHLGQSLMIREGRQMVPTEAGAQLADALHEGFAQIIGGVEDLTSAAQDRPIAVTCTPNFAENWLMPRLTSFWAAYPGITMSITPSNDVVDLRRDGFDIALRYGGGAWPGLDADFLVRGDYVVVAHKDLLAGRRPTCITEMIDIPWIFCPNLPVYRRWATQNGLDTNQITEHALSTMSMISAAVRSGVGASVMIKAMVAPDIASGDLVVIEQAQRPGLGYYVCTRQGVLTPNVKALRKWLISQREKV